jgi:hypothetical protein
VPAPEFHPGQISVSRPLVGNPVFDEEAYHLRNKWLTRKATKLPLLDGVHGSFINDRYLTPVREFVEEWIQNGTISTVRLTMVDFTGPTKAKEYGSYLWRDGQEPVRLFNELVCAWQEHLHDHKDNIAEYLRETSQCYWTTDHKLMDAENPTVWL